MGQQLTEENRQQAAGPAAQLSARSSLRTAIDAFEPYMRQQDFSDHTVQAFLSDLQILGQFVGIGAAVGEISTQELNNFSRWLVSGRGVPCSPKSLARRITTLKVFFGWLAESGVLAQDPAAAVVHRPATAPLPRVLSDAEVEQMLAATQALRHRDPPDARPHLLVTLLLHTGIKKSECMNIVLNHIDLSNPSHPSLWIRYANPRRRHKERRLRLPDTWPTVLAEYRAQYEPQEQLFPCTARNLEYVLKDVAGEAGIGDDLSFEMLRWTCAVRDHRSGMAAETLRQKMGLSKISWRETGPKIARLAGEPL
ncbi:MAG: tyrosine-type recombinase/integrase [Anaerolineae bacterium]|nr:tyrosine-type recombinase/integrase [Anaerolineae bacterium]